MPNEENSFREIFLPTSALGARRWRLRMRSRTAFGHSQHPLDRFKIHLSDVRVAPRFLRVAQGGIKNAPLAVHFVPSHREIMVGSMDARVVGVIKFGWVETE